MQKNLSEYSLALVIANYGNLVEIQDQKTYQKYQCGFQKSLKNPVSGDRVHYQTVNKNQAKIIEILPRKSLIYRLKSNQKKPIAANITHLFITIAIMPDIDWLLVDQYLIFAKLNNLSIKIILNKCDLVSSIPNDIQNHLNIYQKMNYQCQLISAKSDLMLSKIFDEKKFQSCLFVGQSGVGKSSIIQKLTGKNIATKALSNQLGNHCTANTKLYRYKSFIQIIDCPGIREFQVQISSRQALNHGFLDIQKFSPHCQFNDCKHLNEKSCAVLNAVQKNLIHPKRLENYHKLINLYELKD